MGEEGFGSLEVGEKMSRALARRLYDVSGWEAGIE